MLVDLDVSPMIDMTDDEKIDVVAAPHPEKVQARIYGAGEMIKFSKDKVLLLHSSSPRKQAAALVSGMKPCWIPHWRTLCRLRRAGVLSDQGGKGRTARLYAHLQPRFCGRQQAHRHVRYADVSGSERDTRGVYQRGGCGGRIIRRLRHNGL